MKTASHLRTPEITPTTGFRPPRRRWPGLLAVGVVGVGLGAAVVTSFYDPHNLLRQLEGRVGMGTPQVARTADDPAITAAVKAALAGDPGLASAKIEVHSEQGVVRLDGPAPDDAARERAQLIAAASPGVARVDNRLVVMSGDTVTR